MSNPTITDFLIQRDNLHECSFADSPLPEPGDGEVLARIDAFGLTANNITYAVLGESLKYWEFFPPPPGHADHGRLPVWGFAEIAASRHEGVQPGERFYGYWPISSHLVLAPGRTNDAGFVDAAPHRKGLPGLYNQYSRTANDPSYSADFEDMHMLLYPLFGTAFLLADYLAGDALPVAERLLFSSASSRTAFATARLFKNDPKSSARLVGLTSPAKVDFVKGLGYYDEVLSYADLDSLPKSGTIYVDFAGSGRISGAVHDYFQEHLLYSLTVGKAHAEADGPGDDLPGPKPAVFFAPAQGKKRMKEQGMRAFQAELGQAWSGFRDEARSLIQVNRDSGKDVVRRAYLDTLTGRSDPGAGLVLSL